MLGWAGCPFGWHTLDKILLRYLFRHLFPGGGGGKKNSSKQARDDLYCAVYGGSTATATFRALEGKSNNTKLGFLWEVYHRGGLTPSDVPEWARTAEAVRARYAARDPKKREWLEPLPMAKALASMPRPAGGSAVAVGDLGPTSALAWEGSSDIFGDLGSPFDECTMALCGSETLSSVLRSPGGSATSGHVFEDWPGGAGTGTGAGAGAGVGVGAAKGVIAKGIGAGAGVGAAKGTGGLTPKGGPGAFVARGGPASGASTALAPAQAHVVHVVPMGDDPAAHTTPRASVLEVVERALGKSGRCPAVLILDQAPEGVCDSEGKWVGGWVGGWVGRWVGGWVGGRVSGWLGG
jgi:hypothetical protein